MKKALVTLGVGEVPEARWSHPIFKAYANRHGLDFLVISEWKIKRRRPWFDRRKRSHFEKLQMYSMLGDHDRIVYLDSDVLLAPECPDLTALVPGDALGVVADERGPEAWKRREELERAEKKMGRVPRSAEPYFNCGVLVLSREVREVLNPENRLVPGRWPEQTGVNYHARRLQVPLMYLPEDYNFMPVAGAAWQQAERRWKATVVHYAGLADRAKMAEDGPKFLAGWGLSEKPEEK